jgi:hypothetical protein
MLMDNIQMDLREMWWNDADWNSLTQDGESSYDACEHGITNWVQYNFMKHFSSYTTDGFKRGRLASFTVLASYKNGVWRFPIILT